MKKDFNDAIMKLEDFCKTYNALSMEDKLLFAVLGPNGSDVAATVANEIREPKDPHGGLTEEEFSKYSHFGDKNTDSTIEGMSTEHLSALDCAACMLTPDTWMPLKDGNCAMYDSEGNIFDVFIDGEHYFEKLRGPTPKYSSFGTNKKTITVNGEEVPVIEDGEIVCFTVRVKNREDVARVESMLRHIGYLRNNDVNPLVSVSDESYVEVTADDVKIGVYTPHDMRNFPLQNAIKCYAASVSKCEPTFEWHNIIQVTTYSSIARGKVDLVLRHLEEDGIVEAEEDVCDD